MINGDCPPSRVCDFENGYCGNKLINQFRYKNSIFFKQFYSQSDWVNDNKNGNLNWTRTRAEMLPTGVQPSYDQYLIFNFKMYLFK